ncbi:MAG: hypothetical protein R3F13_02260 [Prosthecobacter sp.]
MDPDAMRNPVRCSDPDLRGLPSTAEFIDLTSRVFDFSLVACFFSFELTNKVDGPESSAQACGKQQHKKSVASQGHLLLLDAAFFAVSVNVKNSKQIHPPETPETRITRHIQHPEADEERENRCDGKTDWHDDWFAAEGLSSTAFLLEENSESQRLNHPPWIGPATSSW